MIIAAGMAWLLPRSGHAAGNIERLNPAPASSTHFVLPDPEVLFPGHHALGAVFAWQANPLVWRYADGSYEPVLTHRALLHLMATVGILPLVDVGVDVPLILRQSGPTTREFGDLGATGWGDVRVLPRFSLLPGRVFGMSLGFVSEVTLPTGDARRFNGDPAMSWYPQVVAALPVGRLSLALAAGYRWRKNASVPGLDEAVTLGDELSLRAGLSLLLPGWSSAKALAEAQLSTGASEPLRREEDTAASVFAGLQMPVSSVLRATLGGGMGLSRGLGVPMGQVILRVEHVPVAPDRDGDRVPDDVDPCPDDPEDYDLYADLDGCPEDASGIVGVVRTTTGAGAIAPGAPQDRDNDGVLDDEDKCPDQAEDFDEFEDSDGCPELDNDADGIVDRYDLCPNWAEVQNGLDDGDGCPDALEATVTDEGIEVANKILFETGKAVIKAASIPGLDAVAAQLIAHPEIGLLRIEGHTDSAGAAADNQRLSQARAEAVRDYLVGRGVAPARLLAQGFGEDLPIASNATERGRASNRRVELVIVEQRDVDD